MRNCNISFTYRKKGQLIIVKVFKAFLENMFYYILITIPEVKEKQI